MMHMTFYWGRSVTLLLDSWKVETWPTYALSLLAVFLAAAFYQYLEDRRIKFKVLILSKKGSSSPLESPLLTTSGPRRHFAARCALSALFGLNSAIGYLLMLAVMSFNGGVFIVAVLGLLAGYLVFRSDGEDDVVSIENACACA